MGNVTVLTLSKEVDKLKTVLNEKRLNDLEREINSLKEIIHNLLMTNNPAYKKKKALEEVDDFLGKRFGRTGTS